MHLKKKKKGPISNYEIFTKCGFIIVFVTLNSRRENAQQYKYKADTHSTLRKKDLQVLVIS